MGSGRWSHDDWTSYASTNSHSTKTTTEIYTSRSMKDDLNPKGVTRESCDSDDNPNSTPIIVGLDVTGSMHNVCDKIVREALNKMIIEIHNRKPVTDPHVLIAGIGDVEMGDTAPLQVTQFEADIRLAEQLTKIWLEGGGGGNRYESYALLWWFAANHTKCDAFTKRNKKGFLFTMGDEWPTPYLKAEHIKQVFGTGPQADVNMDEILTIASRNWEIFHLVITQGSYGESPLTKTRSSYGGDCVGWLEVLGQRALKVTDYHKIPEIICSTMQIVAGEDANKVIDSWDGSTAVVVREATKGLTVGNTSGGVATL